MELVIAIGLIAVLYWPTWSFLNLIDDDVPMKGYLYVVPQALPAPDFVLQKPRWTARAWAITVHCLNTVLVYLLLGGKAALLFAVFPVAVNNVAWITGSYYATTTFLTLTAYYFLTHNEWLIGVPLAMVFFAAALNSTVATISFPFVFLFGNPIGLTMLIPLAIFLTGKRFREGIAIRKGRGEETPPGIIPDVFTARRLVVMIKTTALYLYTALVPLKMAFFRTFGSTYRFSVEDKKKLESLDKYFYGSVALIAGLLVVGYLVDMFFWACWFLVLIGAFSNYKLLGQFFAERYIYPASVGLIAILALLPDPFFWALFGAYVVRTHLFIPVFYSKETLYKNGVETFPDCDTNYINLSDWYLSVVGKVDLAGYYIQSAQRIAPWNYLPDCNFSTLWYRLGNYELAKQWGLSALEKARRISYSHNVRLLESNLDNIEKAIDAQKNIVPV